MAVFAAPHDEQDLTGVENLSGLWTHFHRNLFVSRSRFADLPPRLVQLLAACARAAVKTLPKIDNEEKFTLTEKPRQPIVVR
jgi:hypothetical protein